MSKNTVRILSPKDSKRIMCSANDCTNHAKLVETVPLYTGSLAFYYFCHACFKKTTDRRLSNTKKGDYEMRYFEKKQIHSCFASSSSYDLWIVREITQAEFENHPSDERIVSKRYGFSLAYTGSDETFYNVRSFAAHTDKETLVRHFERKYEPSGWTLNSEFLDEAVRKHWKAKDAAYTRKVKHQKLALV